jgi:hypothetical protein
MVAVIVNTNSQRVSSNHCSTWIECHEWVEQYCGWMGLTKVHSFKEHGQLTVWVQA